MVSLLKKYIGFSLPYLLFLVVAGVFLLQVDKGETHIILNHLIYPPFNSFFKYFTNVGDGLMITGAAVILLVFNFRYALFLGISAIVSGGITNFLKNFLYDEVNRPFFYFTYLQSEYELDLILPGSEMHIHNSFPSGHATSAFCLFVGLMFVFNKNKWAWLFFVLALLGGYSRVYLSQHYLVDIYFGSLIGTLSSMFIWLLFQKLNLNSKLSWWNNSLLTIIRSKSWEN